MKIYTGSGEVPFRLFKFPDGQRHFQLLTGQIFDSVVTIESAIRSADELFDVLIAKDTLDAGGHITSLDIRYLLGARMDRRIDQNTPFTLQVVTRMLASAGFRKIRILDPHSLVSTALLNAESVRPKKTLERVLNTYHPDEIVVIIPDVGATERVNDMVPSLHKRQARKHRDSKTGALSGFTVDDIEFVHGKVAFICDDICDGGGTFAGEAAILLEAGALAVDLFVTHGIFSQGLPLAGIRKIYTTDSFNDGSSSVDFVVFPVTMANDQV
jgi:ribose-phosphate pyrophosphokinase